jgi:hypothetical protein
MRYEDVRLNGVYPSVNKTPRSCGGAAKKVRRAMYIGGGLLVLILIILILVLVF